MSGSIMFLTLWRLSSSEGIILITRWRLSSVEILFLSYFEDSQALKVLFSPYQPFESTDVLDHTGIILGSYWDRFKYSKLKFWMMLGPCWDHSGAIWGPFEVLISWISCPIMHLGRFQTS